MSAPGRPQAHSRAAQRAQGSPVSRIWLWPIVIGVLSLAGLIAGLVSEGIGDWLAWVGLALPVLLSTVLPWRRRPGDAARRSGR